MTTPLQQRLAAIVGVVFDRWGKVCLADGDTRRWLGLGPEEIVGHPVGALLGSEAALDAAIDGALDGRPHFAPGWDREVRGTRIPAFWLQPFKPGSGLLEHVRLTLGTALDVSLARSAHGSLGSVFDQLPTGVMIMDPWLPDHPLVYVNDRFSRITGYTFEEAVGRNPRFLAGPDTAPNAAAAMRQAMARREEYRAELLNYRKDGSPFWGEFSISPIFDATGGLTHFIGCQVDLSQARQAERRLVESEARYRLLASHSTDVICQLDSISRICWVSPSSQRVIARSPESLDGQLFYDLVAPEDLDGLRATLRAVATGDEQGPAVFRIVRPDRIAVWVEASVSRSDDGLLLVLRDVTQRRRLEEQFLEANRLEAYGQLAGGVAHDFNNALAVISGNVSLLLKRSPKGSEAVEMLQETAGACERASAVTSQLLALGRKQVQKLDVVDLGRAVQGMTRTLGRMIGEDIELSTASGSEPARVRADATQLQQVLLNLVLNARDAMPRGGRIAITTGIRIVDAAFRDLHPEVAEGRWAELKVSDDGVGISEEALRQIFVPFVNSGPAAGRKGLGLATVLGIVRQSGGHVLVSSRPKEGASFTVMLPEVEAAPAVAFQAPLPVGSLAQQTVLLVEDEADVRRVGARILREEGFAVLEASDGVDALRVVGSHPGAIDVLVTDVVMPGLNGREVAEKVQALRRGLRVLFVSGYTNDTVLRAGISSASAAFIQKPYTAQSLGQAVRDVLGGVHLAAV